MKLLKDFDLKANEIKICPFPHKDSHQVEIKVTDVMVKSKDHNTVLGIMFDSKLTSAKHVSIQTIKANSALHAIKLTRKYFNHGGSWSRDNMLA